MNKRLLLITSLLMLTASSVLAVESPAPDAIGKTGSLSVVPDMSKYDTPRGRSMMGMGKQTPQGKPISGKVVETMSNGGYCYIQLQKKGGDNVWVAVTDTEMAVVIGSQMSFKPGIMMTNFKSKGLNRTFDSIVFSDGVVPSPDSTKKGATPGKQ